MSDFSIEPVEGKYVITGTLIFKDKDGNIVGETQMTGSVQLTSEKEPSNGNLGE